MVNKSEPLNTAKRAMSSLMDGDADAGAAVELCAVWRQDAEARSAWHAYHLIGDVLRSEDLAFRPARDELFLHTLRSRLAAEPVPLAPASDRGAAAATPSVGNRRPLAASGRAGWLAAPAAVAAGFVVVAGLLVVTRGTSPSAPPTEQLAQATAPAPAGSATLLVRNEVLRDARLDRYLEAHRTLGSGVAAASGVEQRVKIAFESK